MRVGILGGGITGIALQRFLRHPSEVLEAAPSIGGLCRTYWKDGFGYDLGGHILFSKNERINQLVDDVLGDNLNRCRRANKIFYKGRFLKYPFENDLAALGPEEAYECLIGYLKHSHPPPRTNLREWAYHVFGSGIAEKYFIPYNEKIWNISADQLSLEFVERIPKPPMEDVVKSALGIPTEGYLHQLYFRYPRTGGTESLVHALRRPDGEVTTGYRVTAIRRTGAGWEVTDGNTPRTFDRIVVAFPIHDALPCFESVPDDVQRAVAGLRYNSMRIVLVGVHDTSLMDFSAVYIPDPSVVTHRICAMGFFSPTLVPAGKSSIIAEITTNPGDGVHELSDEEVTRRTVADLHRVGLVDKAKVVTTDVTRLKYGYPVQDLVYTRHRATLHAWAASLGVPLCGRFAEFDYINTDECLRRAMALADRLNAEA
ncbi:MAG: FAD-dependent oxidoreductase [Deltaproteobacteria bacterium]|nr:FAD-dependent oxidoreductase [Deltaproteobacteria bacterium]